MEVGMLLIKNNLSKCSFCFFIFLGLILSPAYAGDFASARDEIKNEFKECIKEAKAARDKNKAKGCKQARKDAMQELREAKNNAKAERDASQRDDGRGDERDDRRDDGRGDERDDRRDEGRSEESCLDIISGYAWRTEIDEATACCIVEEANNRSCFDQPEGEERDACLNGAASSCGDFEPNDLIEIRH